jgi:hypothetical protein
VGMSLYFLGKSVASYNSRSISFIFFGAGNRTVG